MTFLDCEVKETPQLLFLSLLTMAGLFKNVFGGAFPSAAPAKPDDGEFTELNLHIDADFCAYFADFADFAAAPDSSPSPVVVPAATAPDTLTPGSLPLPYTKWYRVWERTSPQDFVQEAMVLPIIFLILAFHIWGTRKNKGKAKAWAQAHFPVLQNEFAVVGYDGFDKRNSGEPIKPESLLKEKSADEFLSYATGRQNAAFIDVSIKLLKRFNVVMFAMDTILGIFLESWSTQVDKFEAITYTFDGREKELVPAPAGDASSIKVGNSSYDGFIWAIVHKNHMRKFRQDRYDASMAFTKDNTKLPGWVTIMTESAEITDILLTTDLVEAIEQAGDALEYLIITDQPIDKPTKYVFVASSSDSSYGTLLTDLWM